MARNAKSDPECKNFQNSSAMIAQTGAGSKTTSPTTFEAASLIVDSVSARILAAESTWLSPSGTKMWPTTLKCILN